MRIPELEDTCWRKGPRGTREESYDIVNIAVEKSGKKLLDKCEIYNIINLS
jgi:hypothetical protein